MLVIRLRRTGKKNKPSYRVVVAEHSFPIDGRFVEDLGFYNPHNKENNFDTAKALEWMKKGAKPSNAIAKLLEKAKIKHVSVVVAKKNRKPKKAAENPPAGGPAAPAAAPTEPASEEATAEVAEAPVEPPKQEEAPAEEPATEENGS